MGGADDEDESKVEESEWRSAEGRWRRVRCNATSGWTKGRDAALPVGVCSLAKMDGVRRYGLFQINSSLKII
jgi:hypothetical protein